MEVKIASSSLQWPQPIIPSSLFTHKPPFSISSSSLTTRNRTDRVLAHQFLNGSSLLISTKSRYRILKQSCSARLYEFSDEEFSKQIKELAEKFDDSCDISTTYGNFRYEESENSSNRAFTVPFSPSKLDFTEPYWLRSEEIIEASIEMKANSVNIPISLRIIRRKKQWEKGFIEAKDYTYCSMKKAFSSMVFIIRELQSYALQRRGVLYSEDLQEIITRVQREMQASFVWLFQQVFSRTPTLMVYVMILLANFTVYSMANNAVIAATPSPPVFSSNSTIETVSVERENREQPLFDSTSTVETFSVSSSSIGGNNGNDGGGGGGGRSKLSIQFPNSVSSSFGNIDELTMREEELSLWNSMVEEASRMQAELRDDEVLDHDTIQRFVSPVSVKLEADDYLEYFKTELLYQMGLSQDPNSPLLLCNYAQFLHLVTHEYDRAEELFKRAVEVEPPDAEALSRYANFLWIVRKDMWNAEERYQQAMAAEPDNSYHASNYAHFLWNTGGEDTCFPLNTAV